MKIVKLHFYLLVCCGAAEGFIEKSVNLRQNVTLKCEVSVRDVFWFLMKPSEPPVYILHSYSSQSLRADYSNTTFNKTFSLQYNSSLFIHNISTNELGVYYCIQTCSQSDINTPPNISSGIRLYIQSHSAENQTSEDEKQSNQSADKCKGVTLWRSLFIILLIICIVAFAGFIVCRCNRTPKAQAQPPDPCLQQHQGNTSTVFLVVDTWGQYWAQSWFPKGLHESSYTVVEFVLFHPVM
ncbi:uncharacterized protein LOC132874869 isoform X2 [Neoarius graeffei]|uniref:uncharacterized protein LOC132874869 isoform X2 n=1 Tax=Neoarius graeffei TaxID=443677 RepID=UPI00298C7227|nr:uncharacterized protein LOC132874869 isoform X2 [Neoarius graeffei]